MKTLAYWASQVWSISLFVEEGKFRRKLLMWRPLIGNSGWACHSNRKWFAVYRNGDDLIFRCNTWSCRVDESYSCHLSDEFPNENVFSLNKSGVCVFSHKYKTSKWLEKIDPTFDEIDRESNDFFYWLHKLWNDIDQIKLITMRLSP